MIMAFNYFYVIVPDPPEFTAYHYLIKNMSVRVTFNESVHFSLIKLMTVLPKSNIPNNYYSQQNPFFIFNDVDGSATSYTAYFVDTSSDKGCDSRTIDSSVCVNGTCCIIYQILRDSPCSHSSNLTVTVYATNILGNGPESKPAYITIIGRCIATIHVHELILVDPLHCYII